MHAHTNEPVYHHFQPCLRYPPLSLSLSPPSHPRSTSLELRNLRVRLNPRRLIDYEPAQRTHGRYFKSEITYEMEKFFFQNSPEEKSKCWTDILEI